MVDLEFYEIVHERNPLRPHCFQMVGGRMEVPWYYTNATLYFARNASVLSFRLNTQYQNCIIRIDDTSPRWWFPLRQDDSYHSIILQKIADCDLQASIHDPFNLPLCKMLYDMILYKILFYERGRVNESWRQTFATVMLRYLDRHTIDREAVWVDSVIEEGWTRTGGVFV